MTDEKEDCPAAAHGAAPGRRVIAVSERGYPVGDDCPRTIYPDSTVRALLDRVAAGERLAAAAAALGVPYETARDWQRGRRRCAVPAGWILIDERGRRRPLA